MLHNKHHRRSITIVYDAAAVWCVRIIFVRVDFVTHTEKKKTRGVHPEKSTLLGHSFVECFLNPKRNFSSSTFHSREWELGETSKNWKFYCVVASTSIEGAHVVVNRLLLLSSFSRVLYVLCKPWTVCAVVCCLGFLGDGSLDAEIALKQVSTMHCGGIKSRDGRPSSRVARPSSPDLSDFSAKIFSYKFWDVTR